jgi:hypothetical protein
MNSKMILLAACVIFMSCVGHESSKKQNIANVKSDTLVAQTITGLDSLDYLIISEAVYQYITVPTSLGHRFHNYKPEAFSKRESEIKSFVLVDSTCKPLKIDNQVIKKHKQIDSTDIDWMNAIETENAQSFKLDSALLQYIHYKLVPSSSVQNLILHKIGWKKFEQQYGKPSWLIRVSVPAYNKQKDRAIVYVDYGSSNRCGAGGFVWLKKENNKWIAYDLVETFVF